MNGSTGVELALPKAIPENRVEGRFRKDTGLTRGFGVEKGSPLKSGEDYMRQVQYSLMLDHHKLIVDGTNT